MAHTARAGKRCFVRGVSYAAGGVHRCNVVSAGVDVFFSPMQRAWYWSFALFAVATTLLVVTVVAIAIVTAHVFPVDSL